MYSQLFDIQAIFVSCLNNLRDSSKPQNTIKSWINLTIFKFLSIKLHQGPVYSEFHHSYSSLQGEFPEGQTKTVVVPKTIDVEEN